MAIQNRRGPYAIFDPYKLMSGERATVTFGDPNAEDGRAVYECFEPGVVKRMATYEDMAENIDQAASDIAKKAADQATANAEANVSTAIKGANTAATNAQNVANTVKSKLDNGEFIGPVGPKGDPGSIENLPEQPGQETETGAFLTIESKKLKSVLDNLEIQGKSEQAALTGKNLWDWETFTLGNATKNGMTLSVADDRKITISGTSTAPTEFATRVATAGNRKLLPAGTYTLCTPMKIALYETQISTKIILKSGTFTLEADMYIAFYSVDYSAGQTVNASCYPQLEKGTVATAYEPYCGGITAPNPDYPQEIKSVENPVVTVCGKNLFPVVTTSNMTPSNVIGNLVLGTNVTTMANAVLSPGKIVVQAGKTAAILNGVKWINLKPSTKYTLHAKLNVFTGMIYRLFNKGNFEYSALNNGLISVTFTTDRDGAYSYTSENFLYIARASNYTPDEITISEIQLEEGDTATAYEPYTVNTATLTDITLRSMPDGTADRLEKRDGVWGIERKLGTKTYIGAEDENWIIYSGGVHTGYMIRCTNMKRNGRNNGLSNRFVAIYTVAGQNKDAICFGGTTDSNIYVMFSRDRFTTAEDWKAWLVDNPLEVQYALATPTWEPLPDNLQAQLNALQSYTGTTNIFTDSSLQPKLTAEYSRLIPVELGGTGQTTAEGVKSTFGITKLENDMVDLIEAEQNLSELVRTILYRQSIITVYSSTQQTLKTTNAVVALAGVNGQVGDLLTSDGTGVVVGEGVKKVSLSMSMQVGSGAAAGDTLYLNLQINSTEVLVGFVITGGNGACINVPPIVVPVSPGDTLRLSARNSKAARGNVSAAIQTNITARVLE